MVEAHDSPGRRLYGNDCLSGVDCDGNMGVANDNCCYCMSTDVSKAVPLINNSSSVPDT